MRIRLLSLVGFLVLFTLVLRITFWSMDVEYSNVKLMLELELINKSLINATFELDKVLDQMYETTTSAHIKDFQTDRNGHMPLLDMLVNYTTPGTNHPFMLISDISIDKFRIVPDKRRNDYKFVYGIPTIARPQKQKYLLQTLDSLFRDPVSLREMNALIVIMVADLDEGKCVTVTNMVQENHGKFIDEGLLEIICPQPSLYPSLKTVRRTLGDPDDRFMWRSKQNLDFAFLMWYASNRGEYYVQLEDDVIASGGYAYHINDYVNQVKNDFWFLIHFSQLGFIGKLLRGNDLISFVQYLLLFYTNQPCDWLLYDYTAALVCYGRIEGIGCDPKNTQLSYKPSLFQHMGAVSSLGGKVQNVKDSSFRDNSVRNKQPTYSNPQAIITTNLSIYNQNSARAVYNGVGIFWSDKVLEGDNMIVEFVEAQELKGIKIRTGDVNHPQDTLQHGVVELQRSKHDGYESWGEFNDGGVSIDSSETKLVHSIRVRVLAAQENWLIISHFECLK